MIGELDSTSGECPSARLALYTVYTATGSAQWGKEA